MVLCEGQTKFHLTFPPFRQQLLHDPAGHSCLMEDTLSQDQTWLESGAILFSSGVMVGICEVSVAVNRWNGG
jgi:hypothetical protein